MPQPTIKSVQILGLHGHQSISVDLQPGLNIVHARNGVGKTTLLHVLANLAERDLERFCWLRFDRVIAVTSSGTEIVLQQLNSPEPVRVQLLIDGQVYGEVTKNAPALPSIRKLLADAIGGRAVYLPAFRSILEAVSQRGPRHYETRTELQAEAFKTLVSHEIHDIGDARRTDPAAWHRVRESAELTATKTLVCREWFGTFVPVIRCPSLTDVSDELSRELSQARYQVSNTDVEVSGHVFVQVLRAVLRHTPSAGSDAAGIPGLFGQIRTYLSQLPEQYQDLSAALAEIPDATSFKDRETVSRVLTVYEQALSKRIQAGKAAYGRIETFLNSVNQFLESPKRLKVESAVSAHREFYRERVAVDTGVRRMPLQGLSSGERQVVTLLFSATHMSSGDGMLLIDEPELSLHLSWQRILLRELMAQSGERQVVVCTHAPELAADHSQDVRDLKRDPWVPTAVQQDLDLPDDKEPGA